MGSRGNFDHHGLRWTLGGGGYQFYTTSPTVQWATAGNPDTDFFPGGSMVWVKTPNLVMDNKGNVDYEKSVIRAYPTGSLVERHQTEDGKDLWPYFEMPSQLTPLNNIMNGSDIFKVQGAWQVNGFPQHQFFWYPPEKTLLNKKQQYTLITLFDSWEQTGGQLHGCGALSPISYVYMTDFDYDTEPAKIQKTLKTKSPDTDWYGRACLQQVGGRNFIILSATDGEWHCFPLDADQDITQYEAEYAEYAEQAYKASVVRNQSKKSKPEYPSWVCPFVSWRDLKKSSPLVIIFEPRYTWSFNSTGTQAIAVLVERTPTKATFSAVDYTPSGLSEATLPLASQFLPIETEIDPLQIDPSLNVLGGSDEQSLHTDKRGYVELEFVIELTGPNLEDFNFEAYVKSSNSPDELLALGKGVLVNIAYAMPLDWSNGGYGEVLMDFAFNPSQLTTNDVLSVWAELYWHQDQQDLINAWDGEPSLNIPSKAKAVFYKDYPSALLKLFTVPLSQSFGIGYTERQKNEYILPEPPHLLVNNTNATFGSRYPFEAEEGFSEDLYYYTSKISHLDLRSLSFYHTTRLLRKQRGPMVGSQYHKIINRAKTYCAVCVMGKLVDEYFVGHEQLPNSWLKGFVEKMGNAEIDEKESLTPPDFKHHLRGTGVTLNGFTTPWYGDGPTIPFVWGTERTGVSWVSGLSGAFMTLVPNHPWWLMGACGRVFMHTLTLALVIERFGYSFKFVEEESVLGYPIIFDVTFNGPGGILSLIDDLPTFLAFVYDATDSFLYTVTSELGTETYQFTDSFSENPFPLANPRMDKQQFIDSLNNGFTKRLLKSFYDFHNPFDELDEANDAKAFYASVIGTGSSAQRLHDDLVYPRGGGFVYGGWAQGGPNYNMFTEFGYGDAIKKFKKGYRVVDYELGYMYYNSAINFHFSANWMDYAGSIIVRPDGHVSYCKKDLYEISKDYIAEGVGYIYLIEGDKIRPHLYYTENIEHGDDLVVDDVDWKLIDGLHWYYGKIKTKHIYVYNLAYQRDKTKDHLVHNESFYSFCGDGDYKPDFRLVLQEGYQMFYPYYDENGRFESLVKLALQLNDGLHQEPASRPDDFDPRPYKQQLRLSPMFF